MGARNNKLSISSPAGAKLKALLKEKGVLQKDFAKQIGMSASHLSDIINGRRNISLSIAHTLQMYLGVSFKTWMELQLQSRIEANKIDDSEEIKAEKELAAYDEVVSIHTLNKLAGIKNVSKRQCVSSLCSTYNLPSPNELKANSELLTGGYFKRSAKTGLDARMIATWVVLAMNSVREQKIYKSFDPTTLKNLAIELAGIFHQNSNTIIRTHDTLAKYGIKFSIVERIDHASIDGYSFFDDGQPAIVVTKRYDRIDNFAFAVLHEVYHIYIHLHGNRRQMISIVDYDAESLDEKEANGFASKTLIDPKLWRNAPAVQLNKPWLIQRKYTSWAEEHKLNKWIVLGQISHMTGMYKFTTDDTRKIH